MGPADRFCAACGRPVTPQKAVEQAEEAAEAAAETAAEAATEA
ncbi:MAG: hypothetical protein J6T26_08800, partial [Firmicutes bacterium]|nr:hypothetical protein [Bacillota bacterium]